MNQRKLNAQLLSLLDQSGADEYACVYALTDLESNRCMYATVGSMGDATADIDGEDFDGTVYTVSDEAAAERLMTSYAHISLIADLAASRLSKQLGWGPEKYEQLLADCARRLSEQGEEESGL